MFHSFRQTPQLYVEAIEFKNDTVDLIVEKLKSRNIQYRLYTKDMSDDKHKHVIHTVFITQASSELRLTYGMYLVVYDKGHVNVLPKEDFNRRYEAVGSSLKKDEIIDEDRQYSHEELTLWGRRSFN